MELNRQAFICINDRTEYIFNRYMVTILERSGRKTEHGYRIVDRGEGVFFIVLDGLYYRIHQVGEVLTIEMSGGTIELINRKVLDGVGVVG